MRLPAPVWVLSLVGCAMRGSAWMRSRAEIGVRIASIRQSNREQSGVHALPRSVRPGRRDRPQVLAGRE